MARFKRVLLIVLALVAIGAVSATVVALRTYHEATKIDRSHPEVVVGEYVDAFLEREDDVRAALFTCSGESGVAGMAQLRDQLRGEEASEHTQIQVVLGRSSLVDGGRIVLTDIEFRKGNGPLTIKRLQHWRFSLEDDDGWRVCGAEQLAVPSPSATPPTAS